MDDHDDDDEDEDVPPQYRHLLVGPEADRWRAHFAARARLIAGGPPPAPSLPGPPGPGTVLTRWLGWAGIKATPGCGCADMARAMDAWGPDATIEHLDEVIAAMRAEAARRGMPFVEAVARRLVRLAAARSRAGGA